MQYECAMYSTVALLSLSYVIWSVRFESKQIKFVAIWSWEGGADRWGYFNNKIIVKADMMIIILIV